MNAQQLEIDRAIREVQRGPTVIRYTCLICKKYLNEWDVKDGKAVCWKCRELSFPTSRVEKVPESKQPRLVPMKNGLYAIAVD